MSAKKFIVELDGQERERLNALISKGKAPAKMILKARLLLKADTANGAPAWLDDQTLKALDTNLSMVSRVRETFVLEGLDAVLTRKKRETPPTPAIFDGEAQAKLTALACSAPPPRRPGMPDGRSVCWLSTLSNVRSLKPRTSIRSASLDKTGR